jgi:hypothetical protein
VQAAGQIASNDQDAWASADSVQIKPENSNLSVRALDDGHERKDKDGDEGEVSQENSSKALALSLNVNDLVQTADQSRGGQERTLGAPSEPELSAREPKEEPKDHPKDEDAGVSQLNKSFAAALSANLNHTTQTTTQSQDGKGDVAVQASGQVAGNEQKAGSKADSFQLGARNENGHTSGPDLCKHDWCKPDKPDDCKYDRCKPEKPECKHDWCKPDNCKYDRCKPDPCKPHDFEKRDRCEQKRCDPYERPKPCKDERRPVPLGVR